MALLNLAVNARDAMPGGGTVLARTRRAGGMVEVSVADEGVGIPQELQTRVFDLYFTTKQDGNGIGLSLSRQIMKLSGGSISLLRAGSNGWNTTFVLEFE